jgi:hypothetical protein
MGYTRQRLAIVYEARGYHAPEVVGRVGGVASA